MIARMRPRDPSTLMRIGLACLALGNLVHWLVRPTTRFGEGLVDGAFGALLAIAIGTILLALRQKSRGRGMTCSESSPT